MPALLPDAKWGWARRAFASLAAGFLASLPGQAFAVWSLSGDVEHFRWAESTSPSVTETGPRFGVGGSWLPKKDAGWLLGWKGKVYWGSVDYDGATLFGNTPVQGTTRYTGAVNEFVVVFRPAAAAFERLDFVGTVGLDFWERELSSVQREDYSIVFARLGVDYNTRASQGWFAGAGIKKPLYTAEDAHLQDIGFDQNPILRPGKDPSLYAQLGYRFNPHWAALGYYDGYRFGQSASERVTSGGASFLVFQPQSKMDLLGLRLVYSF
jgi:hypothetical protein